MLSCVFVRLSKSCMCISMCMLDKALQQIVELLVGRSRPVCLSIRGG